MGVCTSDTITVENGLTKSQKWLIEWLREGVKDDKPHMAILKDMEEDYLQANKVARDEELSPDPGTRDEELSPIPWIGCWMVMRRIGSWHC